MDDLELKSKYKDGDNMEEKINIRDLSRYLDEECPAINGNEDFGVDDSEVDYSIDSSISSEDNDDPKKKQSINPSLGLQDVSLDDMLSNPFEEAPEFYSDQLDFGIVKELPGTQKQQLQHKEKTLLRNKYWGKIAKSIYDIGASKLPKANHLTNMLELYVINQDKKKEKRKNNEAPKSNKLLATVRTTRRTKTVKRHNFSSIDLVARTLRKGTVYGPTKMDSWLRYKKKTSSRVPISVSGLGAMTWFGNTPATYAASIEIKRRINNLDKRNCKIDTEKLARESKNMLIRMPAFKNPVNMGLLYPYFDIEYPKMVTKYLFRQGFINKWKSGK